MKRSVAVLNIILAVVLIFVLASCGKASNYKKVKELYDGARGYSAKIEYRAIEPVAATEIILDLLYSKDGEIKYKVISPSQFSGMELNRESSGTALKYGEGKIFIPVEFTQAPMAPIFELPALIETACENYDLGFTEENGELVLKMMAQELSFGKAKCFVHFDMETFLPVRCVIKETAAGLEVVMLIKDFEYINDDGTDNP